jgi:pimeloyl-ACP methyl ester carboxylesterase
MVQLHTRSYGDAGSPPLLLLHGLFGSSANWGTVARQLAGRFHVLVPDLRNHGQSPHTSEHSYPAMADDVSGLLQAQGIDQAVIVGHSMGGKVAMQLALTRPAMVERLAVVDMSPVAYSHDFEDVLRAFAAVRLTEIRSRAEADAQMATVLPAPGIRAFLLQNLVKGESGWRWRANLAALQAAQALITGFPDPAPDAGYRGPVSFIYGSLSNYVSPSHWPVIRRHFPAAEACEVEGAGHWVYADRPAAFLACLERLLDR